MYRWGVLVGSVITFFGILGNELAKASHPPHAFSSIAIGVGVIGVVIQVVSIRIWHRNRS
jgi:Co/Zn/Cd efflux system component